MEDTEIYQSLNNETKIERYARMENYITFLRQERDEQNSDEREHPSKHDADTSDGG